MKKISLILAIAMIVCSFAISAFAADNAVATITHATATAGGEVTLTVSIKNSPAIVGAQFLLEYDSNVMSYVSAKGADSSFFTSVSPDAGANPVKITMANLSLVEKSGDITAATVTFKMAEGLKNGNYVVKLSVSEAYNAKIEPVVISSKNGVISVGTNGFTEINMTVNSMTAYVNGEAKTLDAAPVIKNSRTMLPVRFVAENLGATVGWDDATKTVSITGADTTIEIVIGASSAKVNGNEIALDSPAYIDPANNRTYLPVRAVAENLGATVSWDDATKTATLIK